MKIDRQTVITVAVIGGLLALLLVCSIVETLRLPMCAIQVFLIGLVSLKWEEDAWLATGITACIPSISKNELETLTIISVCRSESGNIFFSPWLLVMNSFSLYFIM
jgi:hypothetical protein